MKIGYRTMQHLIPLAAATAAAAAPPPPITFFTFGNSKSPFRELLLNVLHNVHMVPRPPPLVVHCLDDAGYNDCLQWVGAHQNVTSATRCLRADCCTPAQGKDRRSNIPGKSLSEAIALYKIRASIRHIKEHQTPVILMDADAMIQSQACFDELMAYPEDMVAQMEGTRACPVREFDMLGFTINTGVILFRPTVLRVLEQVVQLRDEATQGYPYHAHCYDQEILNGIVAHANPHWVDLYSVLRFSPALQPPMPTLSLRLLNPDRWQFAFSRVRNASVNAILTLNASAKARAKKDNELLPKRNIHYPMGPPHPSVCLSHAAGDSSTKIAAIQDRGKWFLS